MPKLNDRQRALAPFAAVAGVAAACAGVTAAAIAHDPSQPLVWMIAYLILVVALAQLGFGAGRVFFVARPPSIGRASGECLLFNLANLGVVAGTLANRFWLVAVGTALFAASLVLFCVATRHPRRSILWAVYQAMLLVLLAGAVTGLCLSAAGAQP